MSLRWPVPYSVSGSPAWAPDTVICSTPARTSQGASSAPWRRAAKPPPSPPLPPPPLAVTHASDDAVSNKSATKLPALRMSPLVLRPGSAEALDDGGVGHAAALAHGLQAVPAASALQLVEQRGQQLGARAAERVAEGDGAAVDVGLGQVGARLELPGQHDRGEGLVDLEQVDVVDRQARAFEHLVGGGDGPGQHGDRIDPGQGE